VPALFSNSSAQIACLNVSSVILLDEVIEAMVKSDPVIEPDTKINCTWWIGSYEKGQAIAKEF